MGALSGWPGVGGTDWLSVSVTVPLAGSCSCRHREPRRPRLAVPEAELRQVDAAAIFHGLDEILAGHGLPVMALEIEVRALRNRSGPSCNAIMRISSAPLL